MPSTQSSIRESRQLHYFLIHGKPLQAFPDLAVIAHGADTDRLDIAPQCSGLLAISRGRLHTFQNDHARLAQGRVIYNALYACASTHATNGSTGRTDRLRSDTLIWLSVTRTPGIPAALGAALLFGAGTPLAKLLLDRDRKSVV